MVFLPLSWHAQQCPQAILTGGIDFIHKVPDGETIPNFLNKTFPCREECQPASPTPSTSKLFLKLHPIYGLPDSPNITDLGDGYLFELPDIYAGAHAQIATNPPYTSDTNCCCCLRLDYFLTWSQLRVFGHNSRKNGSYMADWISEYFTTPKRICHGQWDHVNCSYTVLHNTCTIAGGNAKFGNAHFDVSLALDRAARAGFPIAKQDLRMEFSVTVVVALNQYCYKIRNPVANCQYRGDLNDCVYDSPQVVNTLAAGQTSYRQTFYVLPGGRIRVGVGYVCPKEINQGDDTRCLETLAETASGGCEIDNFSLNTNLRGPSYKESAAWQCLDPNYFNSDRCNVMHM